jgi:hypothetical protein
VLGQSRATRAPTLGEFWVIGSYVDQSASSAVMAVTVLVLLRRDLLGEAYESGSHPR